MPREDESQNGSSLHMRSALHYLQQQAGGEWKAMAYVRSHAYPLSLHVFPSSGQFSIMNFPPNLSYFTPIENLYKVDIWGMYSIIVADFAHSRVFSKNFWFIR